jgi:hypothetical protein
MSPVPVSVEPMAASLTPRFEPTPQHESAAEARNAFDAEIHGQTKAGSRNWIWIAVAAAVIITAAAGVFASRRFLPEPAAAPENGTLVITTSPPGAQVFVDGRPKGVTPLALTLSAGAHSVQLRGSGEPRTIPVMIAAGKEVAQYLDLPKAAAGVGQLQVKSEPSGARVNVDGTPRGTAPLLVTNLAPGEHTVLLESDFGSVKQTVTVESGMTAALVVPLGAPQNGPASGWVTVVSRIDVQLFENGQLLGSSQSDRIMVTAGRHDIDVVNDALGFRATRTVQVPAGKTASLAVEVPTGTIALNAQPWAEVWIDGEKIGETPIGNYSLAIGTHDVVFRHPELGEQHYTATVTLKTPVRLSVDLRKK